MSSPSKVNPANLLKSKEIQPSDFKISKYEDMIPDLTKEMLVKFVKNAATGYKKELIDIVQL